MGFKNVMKKIGKVALTAAPYVAAPFTGGASLALTGLANKAVQKWSEHDAKDAIAHGLEPSSFDRILGKVGNISSLASSFIPTNALGSVGMLGKAGSTAAKAGQAANKVSGLAKAANIANKVTSGIGAAGEVANMFGGGQSRGLGPSPSVINQGQAVPRPQFDQNNPNLADSIMQGRKQAVRNQPFRKGYDITTNIGEPDAEETRVTHMPQIYSDIDSGRRRRQVSSGY